MDGALYSDWGRRVREAREAMGWSLKAFARACEMSPGALSNIELGYRNPRDEIKWRIAGVARKRVDDLFPWPDEVPPFPGAEGTRWV